MRCNQGHFFYNVIYRVYTLPRAALDEAVSYTGGLFEHPCSSTSSSPRKDGRFQSLSHMSNLRGFWKHLPSYQQPSTVYMATTLAQVISVQREQRKSRVRKEAGVRHERLVLFEHRRTADYQLGRQRRAPDDCQGAGPHPQPASALAQHVSAQVLGDTLHGSPPYYATQKHTLRQTNVTKALVPLLSGALPT